LTGHRPGRAGGPDPGDELQEIDEEEGIAAVHEAFKLGINLFDTSPFYGKTKSETVLGKALKALPRNEIIVATKVGRYGPEEFDFSAETVTREFYNSLERLCVDFVDVLQCHDIEFADMNQVRVGVRAVSESQVE
jgi:L-galactose dehydrogenase